jgi:hypothetical protein
MMNSEALRSRAIDIIRRIQSTLNESRCQEVIDACMEVALADLAARPRPATPRQLIDRFAHLLQDIFAQLPSVRRQLTIAQARDEAAHWITSGPGGQADSGFSAALLRASDENSPGLEVLHLQLGEQLKGRLRQTYVNWVFARHLDPCDWEINQAIAEILLERLRPDLPATAPTLRPEQFVDCIPDLFLAIEDAERASLSALLNRFLPGL